MEDRKIKDIYLLSIRVFRVIRGSISFFLISPYPCLPCYPWFNLFLYLSFCPHISVKRMDGDSPRENAKSAKERFCPLRSSAVHFLRGRGEGTTKGTKGHEKGRGGRQKNRGDRKIIKDGFVFFLSFALSAVFCGEFS